MTKLLSSMVLASAVLASCGHQADSQLQGTPATYVFKPTQTVELDIALHCPAELKQVVAQGSFISRISTSIPANLPSDLARSVTTYAVSKIIAQEPAFVTNPVFDLNVVQTSFPFHAPGITPKSVYSCSLTQHVQLPAQRLVSAEEAATLELLNTAIFSKSATVSSVDVLAAQVVQGGFVKQAYMAPYAPGVTAYSILIGKVIAQEPAFVVADVISEGIFKTVRMVAPGMSSTSYDIRVNTLGH